MSVLLMGEVWGLDVDHARQLILLALADHADDQGRNIYPSLEYVAWKTGYSKRRVRTIVSSLRNEGTLVAVKRASWHYPTHYRLDLSKLPKKRPFKREAVSSSLESSGGKSEASREAVSSSREEIPDHREEIVTSSNPSSESSFKSSEESADLLKKMFSKKTGETPPDPDHADRVRLQVVLVKQGYTADQIGALTLPPIREIAAGSTKEVTIAAA